MTGSGDGYDVPATIDRVGTTRGELVLRKAGDRFEIISNGVLLMDTSDGTSERLLVDAAVTRCTAPTPRLLIGGLGVGFSLVQAVMYEHLAAIDVVEIEATVIDWHERYLNHLTGDAVHDPRVRIIAADILAWLEQNTDRYDVICLDTDNGPNWLVSESNGDVYEARGIDLAYRLLEPGGLLTVWSASRDRAYEERLRDRFVDIEILETPHVRGAPDVVYVVRRPGGVR
jgi:spermidine synthase